MITVGEERSSDWETFWSVCMYCYLIWEMVKLCTSFKKIHRDIHLTFEQFLYVTENNHLP